jgi:hypothetical protein
MRCGWDEAGYAKVRNAFGEARGGNDEVAVATRSVPGAGPAFGADAATRRSDPARRYVRFAAAITSTT